MGNCTKFSWAVNKVKDLKIINSTLNFFPFWLKAINFSECTNLYDLRMLSKYFLNNSWKARKSSTEFLLKCMVA